MSETTPHPTPRLNGIVCEHTIQLGASTFRHRTLSATDALFLSGRVYSAYTEYDRERLLTLTAEELSAAYELKDKRKLVIELAEVDGSFCELLAAAIALTDVSSHTTDASSILRRKWRNLHTFVGLWVINMAFGAAMQRRPLADWEPWVNPDMLDADGNPLPSGQGIMPANMPVQVYMVCARPDGFDWQLYEALQTRLNYSALCDLLEAAEVGRSWTSAIERTRYNQRKIREATQSALRKAGGR